MKRHILAAVVSLASTSVLAQDTRPPTDAPTPIPAKAPESEPVPAALPPPPTLVKAEPAAVSWTDRVKLSGRAYLRYSYELGDVGKNANQFALDRLYLQGEYQVTDNVRVQVTLDAGDTRNATGNNVFLAETKYAFAELQRVFGKDTWVRAGIVPLAWVPYEEDLWGYRVQGLIEEDRFGYITSADLGLAAGGALPAKYGTWQVDVVNGEGYKTAEIAKRKEVQARLTINPLASLGGIASGIFLTGYGSYGEYDDAGLSARVKSRVIAQAGIQSDPLLLVVDYAINRDANSKVSSRFTVGSDDLVRGENLSIFGVLNVGYFVPAIGGLDLFARYDLVDPDIKLDKNDTRLFIGGVGYRFTRNIKGLINYESQSYAADVGGPATNKPTESRFKIQTEVRF